jgi:hypothetical protein
VVFKSFYFCFLLFISFKFLKESEVSYVSIIKKKRGGGGGGGGGGDKSYRTSEAAEMFNSGLRN